MFFENILHLFLTNELEELQFQEQSKRPLKYHISQKCSEAFSTFPTKGKQKANYSVSISIGLAIG